MVPISKNLWFVHCSNVTSIDSPPLCNLLSYFHARLIIVFKMEIRMLKIIRHVFWVKCGCYYYTYTTVPRILFSPSNPVFTCVITLLTCPHPVRFSHVSRFVRKMRSLVVVFLSQFEYYINNCIPKRFRVPQ